MENILSRLFLTVYIILLYKCVIWYMNLQAPTMEQSGLISIVVGVALPGLVYTQVQVRRVNSKWQETKDAIQSTALTVVEEQQTHCWWCISRCGRGVLADGGSQSQFDILEQIRDLQLRACKRH